MTNRSDQTSDARTRPAPNSAEVIALLVGIALALLAAAYLLGNRLVPKPYVESFYAMVVVLVGYLAIRLVTRIIGRAAQPTLGITRARGINNIVQIAGSAIVLAALFGVFGFNLTGLLVGAGFLGIVIGLAAQQVLGNVLAGISIFVSRPFEIGDRVTIVNSSYGLMGSSYSHETEINGITGTIRDIGIFFTRVQLDEGPPSSFPNSQITQSLIISHTHTTLRRIRVRIDIDKRVAFKEFRSRLSQALSRHDEIDPTMSKVRIVDIGGDTYQVAIEVWSHSPDDEPIKTIVLQEALEVQSQLAPESSVAKSPSAESLEGAPVKPSQAPNTNA